MKPKVFGDYAKLKKCVSRTGVAGQWREIKGHPNYIIKNVKCLCCEVHV